MFNFYLDKNKRNGTNHTVNDTLIAAAICIVMKPTKFWMDRAAPSYNTPWLE